MRYIVVALLMLLSITARAQVKLSALPTLNAPSATYLYGIDATPTSSKVPVGVVNGIPFLDASGNLNPTADTVGTIGLSGTRWNGAFFSGTTTTANAVVNGTGGQGYVQLARNTVAPGSPASAIRLWTNLNQLNVLGSNGFNLKLDFSTITADRQVSFPDAAGTATLLGNTATGSGSVVLASAPTIDQLNATTILGWTGGFKNNTSGKIIVSATVPTIASGFGTSPSIVASNGTAAFTVNVGTGGTASSGVVTMPTASTGWACVVTPNAAPQAGAVMYSAPTSTTSITITNYTASTAVALAWPASAVLQVTCTGY